MSAALLQNNKKCNELEDDRESCLHVLTWTALRYTNHTISQGDLKGLLRPFDEAYEENDSVKGGKLKKGSLLERDIPERVKFDGRPHLDELIAELTETFAVRYEKKPSEKRIREFERSRDSGASVVNDIVFIHRERMDSLKRPGWLVETFKRHLDPGSWPTSDSAVEQSIDPRKRRRTGQGSRSHSVIASTFEQSD